MFKILSVKTSMNWNIVSMIKIMVQLYFDVVRNSYSEIHDLLRDNDSALNMEKCTMSKSMYPVVKSHGYWYTDDAWQRSLYVK